MAARRSRRCTWAKARAPAAPAARTPRRCRTGARFLLRRLARASGVTLGRGLRCGRQTHHARLQPAKRQPGDWSRRGFSPLHARAAREGQRRGGTSLRLGPVRSGRRGCSRTLGKPPARRTCRGRTGPSCAFCAHGASQKAHGSGSHKPRPFKCLGWIKIGAAVGAEDG